MSLRFPKSEKLKSQKTIELLFEEGKSVSKFPIKLFYISSKNSEKTKAGFTVPKKSFKKAVDRNRIKRQVREAYRLQKHLLKLDNGVEFALFFLYIGKEKLPYAKIEAAMKSLLKKL